ncbi:MAG: hypothetical protein AABY83_07225 [Pseudomonadota bacterium]
MSDFSHLEFRDNDVPQRIASMLRMYGAVVIRGAINLQFLDALQAPIMQFFEYEDERKKNRQLDPKASWQHRFGVASPVAIFGESAAIPMIAKYVANSIIGDISACYFRSANLFIENNRVVVRRQRLDNKDRQIPYHQDLYTQTKGVVSVLNYWTPFMNCGVDAPSVEVVTVPFDGVQPTRPMPFFPENEAFDKIHITREMIVEWVGKDKFWHPQLVRGDTLVFSEGVIHRTYVTEGMTKERVSMEIRVIADTSLTSGFDKENHTLTKVMLESTSQAV